MKIYYVVAAILAFLNLAIDNGILKMPPYMFSVVI